MKHALFTVFLLIFHCTMEAQNDSVPVFTGRFNSLITESEWFRNWISGDIPVLDDALKNRLTAMNTTQIRINVFLGTWCSDSKVHLPYFLHLATIFKWNYELIGVNREKECPFEKKECKSWDIAYVPTFVVYRNDIEIGRIVENPQHSLAEDFDKIFSKP
jgi:hypothetical protein